MYLNKHISCNTINEAQSRNKIHNTNSNKQLLNNVYSVLNMLFYLL